MYHTSFIFGWRVEMWWLPRFFPCVFVLHPNLAPMLASQTVRLYPSPPHPSRGPDEINTAATVHIVQITILAVAHTATVSVCATCQLGWLTHTKRERERVSEGGRGKAKFQPYIPLPPSPPPYIQFFDKNAAVNQTQGTTHRKAPTFKIGKT